MIQIRGPDIDLKGDIFQEMFSNRENIVFLTFYIHAIYIICH